MSGKLGIWVVLSTVVVVALMFGGAMNGVANAKLPSSYSVYVSEVGLPSGTSWTVNVNGVMPTGTTSTLKATGVGPASFYFYPPTITGATDVQYVPSYSYVYVTVPQIEHITIAYTTQYYTTFAVSPASTGSTSPGTAWYNAGTEVAIAAEPNYGYSFSGWSASPPGSFVFANAAQEATEVAINGVGTVTAAFTAGLTTTTFTEVGLPTATNWKETFNAVQTSGTTSSLTTGAFAPGSYSWSVAVVSGGTGIQYAPTPASGSISVPNQPSQQIVFVKQYAVTWATSGTGTTSPTGTVYYNAGANIPILASPGSSNVFNTWATTQSKVGLDNIKSAGTNATIKASGTVTAKFKGGSQCTTCTLTITEVGLPSGTAWGVTMNSVNYVSTTSKVTISGLTASAYYTPFNYVGIGQYGVAYEPTAATTYWYVGSTTTLSIVYQEYAYISFVDNPGGYLYGAGTTQTTGWYAVGTTYALSAVNSEYFTFSSWLSSGVNLTLASTSSSSTTFTVAGPATLYANFFQPVRTLHFHEFGLPKGTTWGFDLAGPTTVYYFSSSPWINVTGVLSGGYSWSATLYINGTKAGTEWSPLVYSGNVYLPMETFQSVAYFEEALVKFAITGTPVGFIIEPTTSASSWFWVGSVLPLMAENGTSGYFSAWSQSTGTATIVSTSTAATTMTILSTGTITAKFK